MRGRKSFSMAEIEKLKQLFMEKDKADSDEQMYLRRKMRRMHFYISDFYHDMNYDAFIGLCNSDRITITDIDKNVKSDDKAENLNGNEKLSSKNTELQDNENFKKGLEPKEKILK